MLLNVESGATRKVNTWQTSVSSLKFSPDGAYLAFDHSARNQFSQISVYSIQGKWIDVQRRDVHS